MSRSSQGWVVVAFGVVLLVLAATFDDLWEQRPRPCWAEP